jgi:hypothetical protein
MLSNWYHFFRDEKKNRRSGLESIAKVTIEIIDFKSRVPNLLVYRF